MASYCVKSIQILWGEWDEKGGKRKINDQAVCKCHSFTMNGGNTRWIFLRIKRQEVRYVDLFLRRSFFCSASDTLIYFIHDEIVFFTNKVYIRSCALSLTYNLITLFWHCKLKYVSSVISEYANYLKTKLN